MERNAQPKDRKWFRRPWFKILTFIFVTPVWVLSVCLDPEEKKGIKVFAVVFLAFAIAVTVFQSCGPKAQARKALQMKWNKADGASRLEMLADHAFHSAFFLLGSATRDEAIAMLGQPDSITDAGSLVYHLVSTNQTQGALSITLEFDDDSKLNRMLTQGRKTSME